MDIAGKAALITGAAAGIGRAIAVALADRGARHLTLCDIDDRGLAETAVLAGRRDGSMSRTARITRITGARSRRPTATRALDSCSGWH